MKKSELHEVDFKPLPDENVIRMCKLLLERAEEGVLQGIITVCIWDNGTSGRGWQGLSSADEPKIIGEIFMAASKMQIQEDGVSSRDINYD